MHIEHRGEAGGYIYRSFRDEDGKVTSEYVGTGFTGQFRYLIDSILRDSRRYEAQDADTLAAYMEAADEPMSDAFDVAYTWTRSLLVGLGFYQHKYEWRRRRGVSTWQASDIPLPPLPGDEPAAESSSPEEAPGEGPPGESVSDEDALDDSNPDGSDDALPNLSSIFSEPNHLDIPEYMAADPARPLDYYDDASDEARASTPPEGGDPSLGNFLDVDLGLSATDVVQMYDLDEKVLWYIQQEFLQAQRMRTFLDNAPPNQKTADAVRRFLTRRPKMWRDAARLSRLAAHFLVTQVPKETPSERDAALRAMDELRLGLGWAESPPHERLLIDQVALALCSYQITVLIHSLFAYGPADAPTHGPYWEDRLAKTERRLQRAIKTLAQVRKLTRSTKAVQEDLAAYLAGLDAAPEGGHGVTYEAGLRWGPAGSAHPGDDLEQQADAPADPKARLDRVHRFTPREEMREALDFFARQCYAFALPNWPNGLDDTEQSAPEDSAL